MTDELKRINEDLTKSFTHTNADIQGNPPTSRDTSQSSSQSQGGNQSQQDDQSSGN